jgi:hypothetical protein
MKKYRVTNMVLEKKLQIGIWFASGTGNAGCKASIWGELHILKLSSK